MSKFNINRRPHTTTTWFDIKRMYKKHPIKAAWGVPVAFLLLGCQMILYYMSIPFVALNYAMSNG